MSESKSCCRNLADSTRPGSPFDRVIAFGYDDGPTEGFLRCGGCESEFCFRMLDERADTADELDIRAFGLAPLPGGTIERFVVAMAPYQQPGGPCWAPLWSFPSEDIRDDMNAIVDRLESAAGPVELVIASMGWLDGEIIASRPISASEPLEPTDWFAFLGLIQDEVPG